MVEKSIGQSIKETAYDAKAAVEKGVESIKSNSKQAELEAKKKKEQAKLETEKKKIDAKNEAKKYE